MKIILILALFLFSVNSMATTYKMMPPMDKSLKTWIMGGAPYYGDCSSGLTETTVETLNQSQSKYSYDSDGWCSLTSVNFYNSGLEILPKEFKALQNIKTFDLRNNLFTDLDFLSFHKDFTDVYIKNNPDLFNINGIKNATSGNFHFENYKEYDLLNEASPFCQNIDSGNVNIIDSYAYNICEGFAGDDPWLDFIKDCSGNAFNTVQDFKDSTASLNCASKNIYNLPDLNSDITYFKSNFSLSNNNLKDLSSLKSINQAYIINLSDNDIDSLSGLSNLESISALYVRRNPIEDLSGLSNLITVSSVLDVSETNISDFSGLNSLVTPKSISIMNSSSIKSFKGLENIESLYSINLRGSKNLNDVSHLSTIDLGLVYINEDQLEQFTVKAPADSRLCSDLRSDATRIYVYGSDNGYRDGADLAFCEETLEEEEYNAGSWLAFFNDPNNCSITNGPLDSLNDLKTRSATPSCNSKNFVDSDLPQGGLMTSNLNLYFHYNNLDTLSSFVDVTETGHLYLYGNNISSLANLSNLKTVKGHLYLASNPITSLSGLDNLTSVSSSLYLQDTNITDFTGLTSLTTVGQIYIYNTTSVESFKGLENVTSIGTINLRGATNLTDVSDLASVDVGRINMNESQMDQFSVKAPANSRFCNDLRSDATRIYMYSSSGNGYRDGADLSFCEETLEEATYNTGAWLDFFNDAANCSITNGPLDSLNDLKTRSATPSCNSKNFVDSDLPQGGLMTSNLNLYFHYNNLETLSSFVDVTETGHLYLYGNNISSLANLSNLGTVKGHLYLANNPITSLSGLDNLTSVSSSLYLQDTNITDFTGLTSLTTVGQIYIYNTTSVESFKGLENVTSIGTINLRGATNLTDVSDLASVDVGRINMNESQMDQFSVKAPANSRFCNDLRSDATRIYMYSSSGNGYRDGADLSFCEETLEEATYNTGAWLDFFNDTANCSITNGPLDSLSDLKTRSATPNCNSKNLVDSDLPQGGLMTSNLNLYFHYNNLETLSSFVDLTETGHLYLYGNNISSLANLSNLEIVKGHMNLSNNPITSLSGLNNLKSISSTFNLAGTSIADFTGVTSLATVGSLSIYNNTSVESFKGLENVTSIGTINLRGATNLTDVSDLASVDVGIIYMNESQMDQFTVKAPANSRFCNDLRSDATRIYMYSSSGNGYRNGADLVFCEENLEESNYNAGAWIDFFNNTATCSITNGPLDSLSDLKTRTATTNCNSKNLVDSDLPQGGLVASNLHLNFNSNNLETLSAFVDVTETGHFYAQANNITSLANLSNLKTVKGHLYLQSNPITSLFGLSNLTSISSTFNLAATNITDFTGVTSLATVGSLNIYNNTSVESFNGLENVTSIGTINLRGATSLTNISGLANVDINIIYINENQLDQFNVKAPTNSRLCNDLATNAARLYVYASSGNGYRDDLDYKICD